MKEPTSEQIRAVMSALGKRTSAAKKASSAENGLDQRPHFVKVRHFEDMFPHKLVNNEWKDKFPVGKTAKGKVSTYNPDYYCPSLKCYIEVTTSQPNIAEQSGRWREAIRRGLALRVYWWEGQEITDQFASRKNGRKGGRPKKRA